MGEIGGGPCAVANVDPGGAQTRLDNHKTRTTLSYSGKARRGPHAECILSALSPANNHAFEVCRRKPKVSRSFMADSSFMHNTARGTYNRVVCA